jgi:hypothetical protein
MTPNIFLIRSSIETESQSSRLLSREKSKSCRLKRSLLWSLWKWRLLLKTISDKALSMLSLLSLLTSTTLRDKPLKMPVSFLVSMSWESSTNQLLLPWLTDWTRKIRRRLSLFTISEVVLSMFPSYLLMTVFSRLSPLLETLIWEERISIKESLNSSWNSSRENTTLTSLATSLPCRNSRRKSKRPREFFPLTSTTPSKFPIWSVDSSFQRPSPEPSSKSWMPICSRRP